MIEKLDNVFEQNDKLTSKELNALENLSQNPEQLNKVNPKILKDLRKDLKAERDSYLKRSKNENSKEWVGRMIKKVVDKIDTLLTKKVPDAAKKVADAAKKVADAAKKVPDATKNTTDNKETVKAYFKDKKEIKVGGEGYFMNKKTEKDLKKEGIMDKDGKIAKKESLKLYINKNSDKFKTSEEVVADVEKHTGMVILADKIKDSTSFVKNIEKEKKVSLKSPEMPDSNFKNGIFEKATFDKNLLKEISGKISDLTVETDSGKQNIADLLKGKSISFKNGKISTEASQLEKKAETELINAIDNVLKKYDLDPKKVQINFTVDEGGLFSSDSLKAIDASGKKTDNAYDLLPVAGTVEVKDGIIKSLDLNKIKADKNYKLQIDKKEKVLNGKALKEFINDNKFTPQEKDKDKLEVDKEKLTFEELPSLDKNALKKKGITFYKRTEQDGSVKYEFDRKGLGTGSLFVELTKDGKYTISSPRLLKNKNISSKNLQADLIKMDDLTGLKLNLEYDINNLEKKLNKQENGDLSVNVNDEEKNRLKDMKFALTYLKTNFTGIDNYDKVKSKMQDALDGKGKNVQELKKEKKERFKKEILEKKQKNNKEKQKKTKEELNKENISKIDNFIKNNLEEKKFTVKELLGKDFKDIAITSPEFKWLKNFDKDDIAKGIGLNGLEASKDKNGNYKLKFEFNDSWINEDFNKHEMKLETKNGKVILDKDTIISDIKKAAKESVKSMKKEKKEKQGNLL